MQPIILDSQNVLKSLELNTVKPISPSFPYKAILGGVVLLVGSLFIILATNRVLPKGVNALSKLGTGGQTLGAVTGSLGTLTIAITTALYERSKREAKNKQDSDEYGAIEGKLKTIYADRANLLPACVLTPYHRFMIVQTGAFFGSKNLTQEEAKTEIKDYLQRQNINQTASLAELTEAINR